MTENIKMAPLSMGVVSKFAFNIKKILSLFCTFFSFLHQLKTVVELWNNRIQR